MLFFQQNAGDLSGLDLTILGLPNFPGGGNIANFLNSLATAAGGENLTPEQLAAIETQAGGEGESGTTTSCWGDTAGAVSSGPVTFSYGGGAEALLNSEASCGS